MIIIRIVPASPKEAKYRSVPTGNYVIITFSKFDALNSLSRWIVVNRVSRAQ